MTGPMLPETIGMLMFVLGAGLCVCFWMLNLLVGERKGVRRLERKIDEFITVLVAVLTEKHSLVDMSLLDRYIAEADLHEEANGQDSANEVQHGGA